MTTPSPPGGVVLRLAFLVSTVGDWIYRLAVPTLVLQLTGSAVSTAIAYMLEFVPYIAVGMIAGVVADRVNRRTILVICDTLSCLFALLVAGLTQLPHPSIGVLYLFAFLLACVRPFYFPAFQGFLVDVIPERRFAAMNSWTQTVESLLSFVGPVLGTLVIAGIGASPATLLNAISFAISAFLVFRIAYRRPSADVPEALEEAVRSSIILDFLAGLRTLRSLRPVLVGTILMALANLATFTIEGSLFYLVLHVQHLPNVALGVVFGAQGLGAVIGAMLAPKLIERYRTGLLLSWGMGLSGFAILIPAAAPTWGGLVVGWGIEGIATSTIIICWFTGRQRLVPSASIGRIVSVGRAIAYAMIPVGTLLGSWLVTGPTWILFLVAGTIQIGVFVACLLSSLTTIDTRSTEPAEVARNE